MNTSQSYTNIYRTRIIAGKCLPAIIRNSHYFFIGLEVYEDGRVDCWGLEDLETFKVKLEERWVVTAIPDEQYISIYGLGKWKLNKSQWLHTSETFYEHVLEVIRELNPEMHNLHKKIEKRRKGILIGESGGGQMYREENPQDFFPKKQLGDSISIFYQPLPEHYFLAQLHVFANGDIELSYLPEAVSLNYSLLPQWISEGKLLSQPPEGSRVEIYGLGSFTIVEEDYATEIREIVLEIRDLINKLNGQPDSITTCCQILEEYRKSPTLERQQQLKIAYEAIPEHQRMYVGDMDTKDTEVRMIIYGDHEIENWSHYAVAKKMGRPLPSIKVPKPRKKK